MTANQDDVFQTKKLIKMAQPWRRKQWKIGLFWVKGLPAHIYLYLGTTCLNDTKLWQSQWLSRVQIAIWIKNSIPFSPVTCASRKIDDWVFTQSTWLLSGLKLRQCCGVGPWLWPRCPEPCSVTQITWDTRKVLNFFGPNFPSCGMRKFNLILLMVTSSVLAQNFQVHSREGFADIPENAISSFGM